MLLSCLALLFVSTATAQSFETANEAVANMGIGWNLGNTLDANNGNRMADIVQSETCWGQPVTRPELMLMMKEAGFNAMRVPVTWFPHMDNNGTVDAVWMKRVHEVVDYVINAGLYCILNVHHDTGADAGSYKSWLKADETTYTTTHGALLLSLPLPNTMPTQRVPPTMPSTAMHRASSMWFVPQAVTTPSATSLSTLMEPAQEAAHGTTT